MSGCKKLPGDVSFTKDFSFVAKKGGVLPAGSLNFDGLFSCQEVLDYLAMFTDPTQMKAADEAPPVHPLDTVMAAFKDDDAAAHTCNKLQTFLTDAFQVQGKEFPKAVLSPAPWRIPNPHATVFTFSKAPTKKRFRGDRHAVPFPNQELATLAPGSRLTTHVPLDAIILKAPDDGLPVMEDFLTCVVSFLFTGSRLDREPLDLNFASQSNEVAEGDYNPTLSVKKGFTRLPLVECQFIIFSHVFVCKMGGYHLAFVSRHLCSVEDSWSVLASFGL